MTDKEKYDFIDHVVHLTLSVEDRLLNEHGGDYSGLEEDGIDSNEYYRIITERVIDTLKKNNNYMQEEPVSEDLGKVGSLKSLEYYPEKKTTNKTSKGVFDANMPRRKAYLRGFKDGAHAHKELIANKPVSEDSKKHVSLVTERMLKEGPIPTLRGKEKADFENEFNRFRQITGMINWPSREEIYKNVILWFIAWSRDHLKIGDIVDKSEIDEQPVSEELEEAAKNHAVERYRATRDMVLAEKCKWSFKEGAMWNKRQLWKDVQGDDLPMEYVKYQLELRLPEILVYNDVKVERKNFIKDFMQAMEDE